MPMQAVITGTLDIEGKQMRFLLEAISTIGFWFQIAPGKSFKPQATCWLSRI